MRSLIRCWTAQWSKTGPCFQMTTGETTRDRPPRSSKPGFSPATIARQPSSPISTPVNTPRWCGAKITARVTRWSKCMTWARPGFADTSNSRLANIATRGIVGSGDNVMIGGFIIVSANTRVVVRAIGPSLTAFGISGALQDPTLGAQECKWRDSDQQQRLAAGTASRNSEGGLAPTDPRESALITTLPPGQYTAIVSGKGGATGVAVVEGYALQ